MENKTITKEQLNDYIEVMEQYVRGLEKLADDQTKWDSNDHLNASNESGSNPGVPPPPPPPTPQ